MPRRSGEIAASLLKAYLFFRHNTYDAGEGCFVPSNLIFHAKEVMQLVMVTQYFDTLKSIGESDKTNTLFLSHSPAAVKEVSDQILESMLVANRANA